MPFRSEFSEVVPEAGDVAPLVGGFGFGGIRGGHFGGKFCGVVGDFVEVAVVGEEVTALFAAVPLALVFRNAEGGEEWFPF